MKHKNLIVISTVGIKFFNLAELRDLGARSILIYDESNEGVINNDIRRAFHKIIKISGGDVTGAIVKMNQQALNDAIENLIDEYDGDFFLLSFNELMIDAIGELNERFNFTGPRPDAVRPYRDKSLMKEILDKAGLRTPHHGEFDKRLYQDNPESYFETLKTDFGLPLIVKPTNSAGSYGVTKVECLEDFLKIKSITGYEKLHFEVNEFITGKLYHCDTWIQNGKITSSTASEYTYPNLEITNNKNIGSTPLPLEDTTSIRLRTFAHAVLRALGLIDGATHMEIFITPDDEIIFLEVACRAPGALAMKVLNHCYQTNLANYTAKIALQTNVEAINKMQYYAFFAYFPLRAGILKAFALPDIESEFELEWRVNIGDQLKACKCLTDIAGHLFAYHEDADVVRRDFEKIKTQSLLVLDND